MAERRIIMNNKVENFEWHSLLDLSGKGLHKFNAVGKDMTCSQLMNNAGLDWNVEMKEVHFQDNKGRYIDNYNGDKKLYSLVKDDKQILVSNLTESYHPLQNSEIAKIDYSQIVKDAPEISLGFFLAVVIINVCFLFVPMLLGY